MLLSHSAEKWTRNLICDFTTLRTVIKLLPSSLLAVDSSLGLVGWYHVVRCLKHKSKHQRRTKNTSKPTLARSKLVLNQRWHNSCNRSCRVSLLHPEKHDPGMNTIRNGHIAKKMHAKEEFGLLGHEKK